MLKSKHYQQRPPNPKRCKVCGDWFNTELRLEHHTKNPTKFCKKIREELLND